MSMISEQIKKLREAVKSYRPYVPYYVIGLLQNSSDTIESLSAKLADMDRSAEGCGGGWILCSERMPEENEEVICCFKSGVVKALVLFNCKFHGKVYAYEKSDIIAWQPLPEPYHEP